MEKQKIEQGLFEFDGEKVKFEGRLLAENQTTEEPEPTPAEIAKAANKERQKKHREQMKEKGWTRDYISPAAKSAAAAAGGWDELASQIEALKAENQALKNRGLIARILNRD